MVFPGLRSLLRNVGLGPALLLAMAWLSTPARGQTLTTIASFNGTNGTTPSAGVMIDANGDIFGTTTSGGANNGGTVWEIAKGSSTITILASFSGPNGPSGVTLDTNGDIFGTTTSGGANGDGTVWEIAKGTDTIATLASFNGTNGTGPSGVTIDANGNLYGTTSSGGAGYGTVWEIAKGSSTITDLASFMRNNNGVWPSGAYRGRGCQWKRLWYGRHWRGWLRHGMGGRQGERYPHPARILQLCQWSQSGGWGEP